MAGDYIARGKALNETGAGLIAAVGERASFTVSAAQSPAHPAQTELVA